MKKKNSPNPHISTAILEAVDNQLRGNDPPIVKQTYERLIKEGHTDDQTRRLIAYALLVEMNDMMAVMRMFDIKKYTALLNQLPELE